MPRRFSSIVTTRIELPLRTLTEELSGSWHSAPPQSVSSVTIDSRDCQPDSLFVALEGNENHGHDYVKHAREEGAVAALVEEKQPVSLPQYVVADTERALQAMARRYRNLKDRVYVIGITGTCGKTTLKTMLADVLEGDYRVGRTPGNYNNHLGVPLTILNESYGDVLVAEVATNAPGEIGQLSAWLKPDMGIITHVGPAHLEGLETVEKVASEKGGLFGELSRDGIALLPEWIDHRDRITDRSRVLPRSVSQGCNGLFNLEWTVEERSGTIELNDTLIELNFGGDGLVRDAVLASAAATLMGLAPVSIKETLEAFEPLPGRGEILRLGGTKIIDGTYNANPDSMKVALDRLSGLPNPRLAVLGDMRELGESTERSHREVAEYASTLEDLHVVFVGRHEESFREGLGNFDGTYQGVSDVEEISGLTPDDYGSVLLKASRAVGLEQLLDNWNDGR